MSCRAQNQAGQEHLGMAGNMNRRMRLLELEVWSDREHADGANAGKDQLKGSDDGSSTAFRKGTSKKVSNPHRCDEDKENLDPSRTSNQRPLTAVRPSCLHQRYPLQDITALIHSLQGLEMQNTVGISHRPRVVNDARGCRSESSFASKRADMKRSGLLQMR